VAVRPADTGNGAMYRFRIEDHVPEDHLLRAVDQLLDTAFVRKVMAPYYSAIGAASAAV